MQTSHQNNRVFWLFGQERLPKADGGPTDPEGHLQLLCGHHVFHHQDRLLRVVRQREHRHLCAGNGQAGDQLKHGVFSSPPPYPQPFFNFYFSSLTGEMKVFTGELFNMKKREDFKGRELVFLHFFVFFLSVWSGVLM